MIESSLGTSKLFLSPHFYWADPAWSCVHDTDPRLIAIIVLIRITQPTQPRPPAMCAVTFLVRKIANVPLRMEEEKILTLVPGVASDI